MISSLGEESEEKNIVPWCGDAGLAAWGRE